MLRISSDGRRLISKGFCMSDEFRDGETVTVGVKGSQRASKIERYGWILRDTPGQLMWIDKGHLSVDHSYQRDDVNELKVKTLAKSWSWTGCGVLSVARRPSGDLFVFDGQHRLLAALRRSDIRDMPCVVFDCESTAKEAAGFLVSNSERKAVSAVDKFRSMVMTENESAVYVKRALDSLGLEVTKCATRPGQIKCIARCIKLASQDQKAFDSALLITSAICEEVSPISEELLTGMFTIHRKHRLLDDQRFVRRAHQVGRDMLIDGIRKATLASQNRGENVIATGILGAVNKGLRVRFGAENE
jgi:hypothetical protein